jgi:hypothetical protein
MLREVCTVSTNNWEQNQSRTTSRYYPRISLQKQSWWVNLQPYGIDAVKFCRSSLMLRLHLQGRRISQAINNAVSSRLWRQRQYVPPTLYRTIRRHVPEDYCDDFEFSSIGSVIKLLLFSLIFLYSSKLYRMMRRGRRLTPSPTKNKHK